MAQHEGQNSRHRQTDYASYGIKMEDRRQPRAREVVAPALYY